MNIPVSVKVKNPTDRPQTAYIPKGQIFEVPTKSGVQNVALSERYEFTVPPRTEMTIIVYGYCLNQNRPYPSNTPGSITSQRYVGPGQNQTEVWEGVNPKK